MKNRTLTIFAVVALALAATAIGFQQSHAGIFSSFGYDWGCHARCGGGR